MYIKVLLRKFVSMPSHQSFDKERKNNLVLKILFIFLSISLINVMSQKVIPKNIMIHKNIRKKTEEFVNLLLLIVLDETAVMCRRQFHHQRSGPMTIN